MSREDLLKTMDAKVWARSFMELLESDIDIEVREDMMETWFANAIMVGWDARGAHLGPEIRLREIVRHVQDVLRQEAQTLAALDLAITQADEERSRNAQTVVERLQPASEPDNECG